MHSQLFWCFKAQGTICKPDTRTLQDKATVVSLLNRYSSCCFKVKALIPYILKEWPEVLAKMALCWLCITSEEKKNSGANLYFIH